MIVVEQICINRILDGIRFIVDLGHLRSPCKKKDEKDFYEKLGQDLLYLCNEALKKHLKKRKIVSIPTTKEKFIRKKRTEEDTFCSLIQAYKSLIFLMSQCDAEDCDNQKLLEMIIEVKSAMADAIICGLPEFEQAIWG